MKQALMVTIVSIMLFAACSSNSSSKTQYYLLDSPTMSQSTTVDNQSNAIIAISLLALPDYLRQPSLVLQLSDHQLYYSHFHMWAEPLDSSFTQALSKDLNNIASRFHYIIAPATSEETTKKAQLIVDITAFHPTHQSQAILAGTYWLKVKGLQDKAHDFKFTIELNENGYEHAVEQMRKVIRQLAQEISNNLMVG